VVLSYLASLGVTAFVFTTVLGQGPLAFWVPPFLFVILVALGADYTVFVMGRIKEARRSGLDVPQAAVEGLVGSGPVISAAGLILAGTFLALLLAPLPPLQEVGFAVGFGVLLDTFVVRPLLVPALTAMAGTWAFWPGERASDDPKTSKSPDGGCRDSTHLPSWPEEAAVAVTGPPPQESGSNL
jgi:RND superfamily putative drug exporter